MQFIFVIEDELRFQNEIFEAAKAFDAKLQVRFFESLAEFHDWLKIAVQEGPLAISKAGKQHIVDETPPIEPAANHELRLVISKNEFLGTQNMDLVRRAREFFLRKKICTPQDPTALIITSFDDPNFNIKLAEDRIIYNVLYKPFDSLILRQDIAYAITGRHPIKDQETIPKLKLNSTIEMIKQVTMTSVSEVGFETINNAEIAIGSVSKYYSDYFQTESKKSVFAVCRSSRQISEKEFVCGFNFFGTENDQISQLRKKLLTDKNHKLSEIQNNQNVHIRVIILDSGTPIGLDLKIFLSERFPNTQIFMYTQFAQLISDLKAKDTPHKQEIPTHIDYVFADYDLLKFDKDQHWQQVAELLKQRDNTSADPYEPDLLLYSKQKISSDEQRNLATICKDIFFIPFDKGYMSKKLTQAFSNFNNKNPISIASLSGNITLKAANPIQITQISEAGLVMKYYRTISLGAFREFILVRPNQAETETPEILGTVNFHEEESQDGEEYFLNHIVFFGMKDLFLKHIRLWIRDIYVKMKALE